MTSKYKVELTDECKKDIRIIYYYIRYNLEAKDAAKRLIDKFELIFNNLEYFPRIYYKGRNYLNKI